jgi:hypothetical protein
MRQTPQSSFFKNQSNPEKKILQNAIRQQMSKEINMPSLIDQQKYKLIPAGFKLPKHLLNTIAPEACIKISHSNNFTY